MATCWSRNRAQDHPRAAGSRAGCKTRCSSGGRRITSANRITLLRDTDGDGVAERTGFLEHLNQPFGMLLCKTRSMSPTPTRYCAFVVARTTPASPPRAAPSWPCQLINPTTAIGPGTSSPVRTDRTSRLDHRATSAITALPRRRGAPMSSRSVRMAAASEALLPAFAIPSGSHGRPGTRRLWATVNERDMLGNDLAPVPAPLQDVAFYGGLILGRNILIHIMTRINDRIWSHNRSRRTIPWVSPQHLSGCFLLCNAISAPLPWRSDCRPTRFLES